MKVLKIIGDIDIALDLPENAEVTTSTLENYLDSDYQEKFDMIFCAHVLQTLWAKDVSTTIGKLVGDLAQMGELHIHVPAMDYAGKVFTKGVTDPIAFYLMWGTPERPFHTGFTLLWLRALVMEQGALVRSATVGLFKMTFEDREVEAPQHVVLATVLRS